MDTILRHMTFALGYRHGEQTGEHVSNREVAEQFPYMTDEAIEIYQNGRDDGIAGDDWRLKAWGAAMNNDPSRKGQCAAPKRLFGEYHRYAVAPVYTRFDAVEWFVWDAHETDPVTNGPAVIRQAATEAEAIAGLEHPWADVVVGDELDDRFPITME